MRSTLNQHSDPNRTMRQVLPYTFQMMFGGKLRITNTRGQTLFVSQVEVVNILKRDDLDAHRRKMYEAALEEFEKANKAVL